MRDPQKTESYNPKELESMYAAIKRAQEEAENIICAGFDGRDNAYVEMQIMEDQVFAIIYPC